MAKINTFSIVIQGGEKNGGCISYLIINQTEDRDQLPRNPKAKGRSGWTNRRVREMGTDWRLRVEKREVGAFKLCSTRGAQGRKWIRNLKAKAEAAGSVKISG